MFSEAIARAFRFAAIVGAAAGAALALREELRRLAGE